MQRVEAGERWRIGIHEHSWGGGVQVVATMPGVR